MTRGVVWPVGILLLASAPLASADDSPPPDTAPPFQLTVEQEREVDGLLDRWQQWNAGVRTFDCQFKRWIYDSVFGPADKAKYVDLGAIRYDAPDHALFRVDKTEKDGKVVPIEDARGERWIYDGKSIFEFSAAKKQLIEHKLPNELQGMRLVDGPLAFAPVPFAVRWRTTSRFPWIGFDVSPVSQPFPFGAKVEQLKQQYYIRVITPPDQQEQIWLEAFPRDRQAASFCRNVQLIFHAKDMSPFALRIVQPNGKDYTVYQFYGVHVNQWRDFDGDPFVPALPLGWKKVVEEPPRPREQAGENP
jgi:TIGR03009 family protein